MDKYLIKIKPMTTTKMMMMIMMMMMMMMIIIIIIIIIVIYCKWKLQQDFLHFLSVTQCSYTNDVCHDM